MKKTYIIPELNITKLAVENMIAASDLSVNNEKAAVQNSGMEVKSSGATHSYNVWDEAW